MFSLRAHRKCSVKLAVKSGNFVMTTFQIYISYCGLGLAKNQIFEVFRSVDSLCHFFVLSSFNHISPGGSCYASSVSSTNRMR